MAQQHHWNFSTRAVHVGNEVDKETGAIRRPITMANSYALPYDPTDMNWSSADGNLYTRNGGANQKYLQEKLSSLEGGEDCVVLASGVAALSGLFFSLLQTGDHVIFSSVTYIAVYRLLNELFNNKFNVETTIVNTSDLEAVKAAIRPNTKLIHIETPGNPTLSISDIEEIAKIAHQNGALLSVDNTFASPYNQRPIELGADFVVESLTKYINGHGDAMGGAIIGKKEYLDFAKYIVDSGGNEGSDLFALIMAGTPLREVGKPYPKAYEMTSVMEGLAEYYRATGDPRWLDCLSKFFNGVKEQEITIIGNAGTDIYWPKLYGEGWGNTAVEQSNPDVKRMMETCVGVTWMKFCSQYLRLTGDPAALCGLMGKASAMSTS